MAITRIPRVPSLVHEVSQRLAAEVALRIASGEPFLPPERELAPRLGVSRPVIREATKRLELQGLVEIEHGVGTRVVDKLHKPLNGSLTLLIPDPTERLRQLNETRLAIEPAAAAAAAERATAAQRRELRAIHQRLAAADDSHEAIACDVAFHRALAEASGNLMFRLILDSLADIGLESRQRTIGRVGKAPAVLHHAEILAGLERRDPAAACAAMQRHIEAAGRDMQLDQLSTPVKKQRTEPKRVRRRPAARSAPPGPRSTSATS